MTASPASASSPGPLRALAHLTADIPGIGGRIKARPEDFVVEERPLYELSGTGEHLYLFIEKRSLTTSDLVRRVAKAFRIGRREVGAAGMKDKHAVTRQWLSVWGPKLDADAQVIGRIESDRVKVLEVTRHGNKLRTGHHAGNRFDVRIRDVPPHAVLAARRVLDRLAARGVPNYVGEQRFGTRGDNHLLGRLLLKQDWQGLLDAMLGDPRPDDPEPTRLGRAAYERGDYAAALDHWPRSLRHERQPLDALRQGRSPRDAVLSIDRLQLGFMISAMQSAVFNQVLHARLRIGAFDRLLNGDLAWKHDSRAVFAVDEAIAEAENGPDGRVGRHELSPSGPMWGPAMPRCTDEPGRIELEALAGLGLEPSELAAPGLGLERIDGQRRPLRAFLRDASVGAGADEHGPYVRVRFELPRGAFATVALREIMKNDAADQADGE